MKITLNNKEVYVSVYGKYDDDIQIDEAYYMDTETPLTDSEIEQVMNDYSSEIYEEWYENQVCAAEYYRDSMEDR